jgi:hypothetical protein
MAGLLRQSPPREGPAASRARASAGWRGASRVSRARCGDQVNRASFDTYVRARFLANESFNREPTSRAVYRRWRSQVLEAFQCESGRICGSYYCEHLIGATHARIDRDSR